MKFLKVIAALLLFLAPGIATTEQSHKVLVSVAPHKFFVEKIGGSTVTIELMVPAGASAHTFEPTPKQMLSASQADAWFCIGESFEARASQALKSHHPELKLIDLRLGVNLITADPQSGVCCCHGSGQDLHIWLSAREAKIQAATIANALMALYPEHKELYRQRVAMFIQELEALDAELTKELKPVEAKTIMVSHPAYAYFCRDYNLKQLSIEFEGKDPAPKQLNLILNQARKEQIKKIFIQKQYSSKGARLFAEELHANIVTLDPYAEDYMNTMLTIGKAFSSP